MTEKALHSFMAKKMDSTEEEAKKWIEALNEGVYESIQNLESLTIKKIENLEKAKENPNMPIELEVCYAGATGLPQIIADRTGRSVFAYKGTYIPGWGVGINQTVFRPRK